MSRVEGWALVARRLAIGGGHAVGGDRGRATAESPPGEALTNSRRRIRRFPPWLAVS
jgi:hypothetical protein